MKSWYSVSGDNQRLGIFFERPNTSAITTSIQVHGLSTAIDTKKNVPIELKAFKDGKMQFTVEYLSYETDLPFDSSLFDPPKDVHLSEANR